MISLRLSYLRNRPPIIRTAATMPCDKDEMRNVGFSTALYAQDVKVE